MNKPHLIEAAKFIEKCIALNEERDFSFRLPQVHLSVDNPLKIFVFESDFEGLAESEDGLHVLTISPYLKVVHFRENYDALHKHSYRGSITLGAFYDKDTVDASPENFLALQYSMMSMRHYFPEYGAEFNKLTKKPICIMYHDKCLDGLASAWVANKYFTQPVVYLQESSYAPGEEAAFEYDVRLVPVNYGDDLPEIEDGIDVVFVDFCPTSDQLKVLAANHCVLIIDHHETALKHVAEYTAFIKNLQAGEFESQQSVTFCINPEKCGATLAWENFFLDAPTLPALLHVEDRDLWNWKLENTLEYTSFLSGARTVEDFDAKLQVPYQEACAIGKPVADYKRTIYRDLANSHPLELGLTENICIGFIPCTPKFTSEVCDLLLELNPNVDVVCAYEINVVSNKAKLSFRSRKLNKGEKGYGAALSVSEGFNGGGHPSAAGAKIDADTFTHLVREYIKATKEK